MALTVYLISLFLGIAAFTAGWWLVGAVFGVIMLAAAVRYELLWLMRALKPYKAPRVSEV